MIISDQHRYLFIEVPRTGSTAIGKELCKRYDGKPILHKHSHYSEFLRMAKNNEKNYFVFQGKRNPLDEVVSRYFKLKNNHKGNFTNPQLFRSSGGWINEKHLKQFEFVQKNDADFSAYFKRYYKVRYLNLRVPYFSPYDWPGRRISNIIRFENLEAEFESAIKAVGLQPQRPLRIENKTQNREQDCYHYYPPELRRRTISIFGPYMRKWGYVPPDDWGNIAIPIVSQWKFKLIEILGAACFRIGVVRKQ